MVGFRAEFNRIDHFDISAKTQGKLECFFFSIEGFRTWLRLNVSAFTTGEVSMNQLEFKESLNSDEPPTGLNPSVTALWWDAKGDWNRAHSLVDELESIEGMAVHAYLHRKEGAASNAEHWYQRAGRQFHRPTLEEEWSALVDGLLPGAKKS
ncbi:MAG TPA: hypothetical protein VFI95_21655 [Terriglobales bacterium]|nr:hypothetical protein [Terriglobales bacterium]